MKVWVASQVTSRPLHVLGDRSQRRLCALCRRSVHKDSDVNAVQQAPTRGPELLQDSKIFRDVESNRLEEVPKRSTDLDHEVFSIALPMLASLAADPLAGLVDTAYVGRLGAEELAGVGLALSIFNTLTKLVNVPLLSVTTSKVAAASGLKETSGPTAVAGAASASLAVALLLGVLQAVLLLSLSPQLLRFWGVTSSAPFYPSAVSFLHTRLMGAPVLVLLLVTQGTYRGLRDTKTPFYATVATSLLNIILVPLLMFKLELGFQGAALGTVIAEAVPCWWMIHRLNRQYPLSLADMAVVEEMAELVPPTGFLALRTLAVTSTYAVATALATRDGAAATAAHQICFQLWLASSLLADSLAVAAQTLVARSLAVKDRAYGRQVVGRTLNMSLVLGMVLALVLAGLQPVAARWFTQDEDVLNVIHKLFPFIILTQPLNALAFFWDGVLFGVGGFRYASLAMVLAAVPAIGLMLAGTLLSEGGGEHLQYVWGGLSLVMVLRWLTIYIPYASKRYPFDILLRGR